MRRKFVTDIYRMAATALQRGAIRKGITRIEWDISGRCVKPYSTVYFGRPSYENANHQLKGFPRKKGAGGKVTHPQWIEKTIVVKRGADIPMEVTILTACHKCEPCLKARQRLWTARAVQEIKDSVRTWYGTLTLRPDAYMLALMRARAKEAAQGVAYDLLEEDEKFALLHAQIRPEIQKYLKRLRAAIGPETLRHLVVVEAHQSGVPHYHALIHECDPARPVRKRQLDAQWKLGFSQWRLVSDIYPAGYVCKYLAKDMRARLLASEDYGSSPLRQSVPEWLSVKT